MICKMNQPLNPVMLFRLQYNLYSFKSFTGNLIVKIGSWICILKLIHFRGDLIHVTASGVAHT